MRHRHPVLTRSRSRGVAAWLALLLACVAPSLARAVPAGIVPGPAVGNTVRFSLDVPPPVLEPLGSAKEVTLLRLDGFDAAGRPGATLLPERTVWVAVPPTGEVTISATAADWRVSEGVTLATQPIVARGAAPSGDAESGALANLAGTARATPATPLARIGGVSWVRDQRIALVVLAPARYDAARRRLEVATRLDVTVGVAGAAAGAATPAAVDTTQSRGPYEEVFRGALVNYAQGRAWRARGAVPGRYAGRTGLAAIATTVPDTSVYAGHGWAKIAIEKSGFYRVTWAQLRNTAIFLPTPAPALDSLRMFTWPGYPVLPEASYCDSCDYREVALQFEDDLGDGRFGVTSGTSNDALYFYAMGASDWGDHYDPSRPDTEYVNHPYETLNYYYLTIATAARPVGGTPRRIATASAALGDPTGVPVPLTFVDRLHMERDTDYEPDATPTDDETQIDVSGTRQEIFWEKWFWRAVNQGESFPADAFDLPGYDTTQPARLRMLNWGLTTVTYRSPGIHDHYLDVTVNGSALPEVVWDGRRARITDTTSTLLQPTGNLVVSTTRRVIDPRFDSQRVDQIGLAWIDVFYPRRFQPVNDELTFDSPGRGDVIYDIGPFSTTTPPSVFDITDPLAPVELLGGEWTNPTATTGRLRLRVQETGRRRYAVLPSGHFLAPLSGEVFDAPNSSLENLRGLGKKADYLVIYYDGFRGAADELLRWRRLHLPIDGASAPFDTASVPISALYDQFSGGRTDPTAIRNFLRTIYYNWAKKPVFVTLLGDASYDFKNITGEASPGDPGALLPSYENGFDTNVGRQYDTDDWLLNVDDPNVLIPDFVGGRIPAGTATEALVYVRDKLIPYESTAPTGLWRDGVMLIGDDNFQGPKPDDIGWGHVLYSAQLDTEEIPRHMDRDYVYLHTYPTGASFTKPGAKADIVAGINGGIALVNYVGHGSPFKIADESVYLDSDASAATNADKLTVFCAASCDVGKFNDPKIPSLGERLVLNPTGGAVGVVSATELAFSYQNAQLNLTLFNGIFTRSAVTGTYSKTVSASLLAAKGSVNSSKYQLMGDAAVRTLLPSRRVEVSVTDGSGNPVTTVQRGQRMYVRGRVLQTDGVTLDPVDGKLDLRLEESTPIDTVPGCVPEPGFDCVTYPYKAAPIYRGDVDVRGGVFEASCTVPVDAHLGVGCRARGYFTDAAGSFAGDGAGSADYAMVAGPITSDDHSGPAIVLSFPGGSTTVKPDATLRIDVSDPSGVLITGNSPQNSIIVTLDANSTLRTDVTPSFRYATGSATAGTATYPLGGLSPGPHHIDVSAADNLAGGIAAAEHRSTAGIDFVVSENPTLRITRAFLFPNPIRSGGSGSGGTFVVDVPGDSVNVLVRIYTVGGRMIKELAHFGGLGQVQLPWDGRDNEGDVLANGTYLYRVHVNPRDPDGSSSARQRASIEGRIVVVGH